MSATDTTAPDATEEHTHHPTPRQYVRIAVILALLTALEVSTYWLDFGAVAIPLLITLMIIKFTMVVGWFMHLKFDTKLFGRLLYGGLFLALSLYAVTLVIFIFEPAPTV